MKCTKAQELYYASRDGFLDESGRMRLAEHLASCPSCALFVKETDACLGVLRDLPELSPSEGFEWNVKRRIHEERNRLGLREGASIGAARRWMPSFALGAAAAAVVAVAAIFAFGRFGAPETSAPTVARSGRPSGTVSTGYVDQGAYFDYAPGGGYAAPRMVSDNVISIGTGPEAAEESAFRFVSGSREDSLMRENELLRRRIDGLERRMILLQQALERERAQRLNLSLP
ncbi:MAG: zf-HC2 domain-containing protein [Candidatus Latescibacterota bacterium]|jgi:hypothetical protein|nr:MAG: zf-HC2 domain-containing protein [Candidatus Latescibacterota bacterium]